MARIRRAGAALPYGALDRDHLVKHLLELARRVGVENVTMRALATEAGTSASSVYYHVKDKAALLDQLGLHWFEHLPVLMFALPASAAATHTTHYSYRLQLSYRPHEDYLGDVRNITRPLRVLVGANDELFIAERYAPLLEPQQALLKVKVLPGVGHIGMVTDPVALAAILAEL